MKRGDVVTVALSGDLGNPRPAIVVQSDILTASEVKTVLVCPVTSFSSQPNLFRVPIDPAPDNGLLVASEVTVDKISPASRTRIKDVIGAVDELTMRRLERSMPSALGFAG